MIGSSSTWGQAELDRFDVKLETSRAKGTMIPEKWFDFRSLDKYAEGCITIHFLTNCQSGNS